MYVFNLPRHLMVIDSSDWLIGQLWSCLSSLPSAIFSASIHPRHISLIFISPAGLCLARARYPRRFPFYPPTFLSDPRLPPERSEASRARHCDLPSQTCYFDSSALLPALGLNSRTLGSTECAGDSYSSCSRRGTCANNFVGLRGRDSSEPH
jgi:hypothetical protein